MTKYLYATLLLLTGIAHAQQQIIDTGTPNSGTGDSAYVAFGKVNNNFTELFNGAGGFPQIAGYSIVCNNTAIQATPAACGALPSAVTVTATQITSGTLACARLPTFTGEITTSGCAATVTGLNGATVPLSAALVATNGSGQVTPITLGTNLSITGGVLNATGTLPTTPSANYLANYTSAPTTAVPVPSGEITPTGGPFNTQYADCPSIDGNSIAGVTATAGSPTITVSYCLLNFITGSYPTFTTADIGKNIAITGAGTGNTTLYTTISNVPVSPCTANASTTCTLVLASNAGASLNPSNALTGSIAPTTLNVTAITGGNVLAVGQQINVPGINARVLLMPCAAYSCTGAGGTGTYTVNGALGIGSETMTTTGYVSGSITGTTLTTTTTPTLPLAVGQTITGIGVAANTVITGVISGTSWTVNNSQTTLAQTLTNTVSFTASIAPPTLTVTAAANNTLAPGQTISAPTPVNTSTTTQTTGTTVIVAQLSGTTGGAGTYSVNNSQTKPSVAVHNATGNTTQALQAATTSNIAWGTCCDSTAIIAAANQAASAGNKTKLASRVYSLGPSTLGTTTISFTATISNLTNTGAGNVMNVTGPMSIAPTLEIGQVIAGPGVTSGTTITGLINGTGGLSTYTVSNSMNISTAEGMTATNTAGVLLPNAAINDFDMNGAILVNLQPTNDSLQTLATGNYLSTYSTHVYGGGFIDSMGLANYSLHVATKGAKYDHFDLKNPILGDLRCDGYCTGDDFERINIDNAHPGGPGTFGYTLFPTVCVDNVNSPGAQSDNHYTTINATGCLNYGFYMETGSGVAHGHDRHPYGLRGSASIQSTTCTSVPATQTSSSVTFTSGPAAGSYQANLTTSPGNGAYTLVFSDSSSQPAAINGSLAVWGTPLTAAEGTSATLISGSTASVTFSTTILATTITNSSPYVVATNTLTAGMPVVFSASVGTGSGGVVAGTIYYVSATGLGPSHFQVATTTGGTPITFNASGTPNATVQLPIGATTGTLTAAPPAGNGSYTLKFGDNSTQTASIIGTSVIWPSALSSAELVAATLSWNGGVMAVSGQSAMVFDTQYCTGSPTFATSNQIFIPGLAVGATLDQASIQQVTQLGTVWVMLFGYPNTVFPINGSSMPNQSTTMTWGTYPAFFRSDSNVETSNDYVDNLSYYGTDQIGHDVTTSSITDIGSFQHSSGTNTQIANYRIASNLHKVVLKSDDCFGTYPDLTANPIEPGILEMGPLYDSDVDSSGDCYIASNIRQSGNTLIVGTYVGGGGNEIADVSGLGSPLSGTTGLRYAVNSNYPTTLYAASPTTLAYADTWYFLAPTCGTNITCTNDLSAEFGGLALFDQGVTVNGGNFQANVAGSFPSYINTGTATGAVHIADGTGTGGATIGNSNNTVGLLGGVVNVGNTSGSVNLQGATVTLTNPLTLPIYTVSSGITNPALPACGSGNKHTIAAVSDASSPTYLGALTGGGTTMVKVLCNGTAWVAD